MTTIIINEKTKKGKIILELLNEMGIGKILPPKTESQSIKNQVTLKAMKDAIAGHTTRCKDFKDYLEKTR